MIGKYLLENSRLKRKIKDKEDELKKAMTDQDRLSTQLTKVNQQNKKLKQNLDEVYKDYDLIKEQRNDLERDLAHYKAELSDKMKLLMKFRTKQEYTNESLKKMSETKRNIETKNSFPNKDDELATVLEKVKFKLKSKL